MAGTITAPEPVDVLILTVAPLVYPSPPLSDELTVTLNVCAPSVLRSVVGVMSNVPTELLMRNDPVVAMKSLGLVVI